MTWQEKREEFIEWVGENIDGLSVREGELLEAELDRLRDWIVRGEYHDPCDHVYGIVSDEYGMARARCVKCGKTN